MKLFKKSTAILLAAIMLFSIVPFAFAGNDGYTITNPYADVNWDTVKQYKAALHTHTNASDGDDKLSDSIERHYETGYDIVATTDHGISNKSWTEKSSHIVTTFMSLIGKTDGDIVPLVTKGTFSNGVAYETKTINGDDYVVTADRSILRVPFGNENNALSVNAHVNSWFAYYENNLPSDYRTAILGVDKAGGLSVINHPGEYTQARYELYEEDAYNMDNWSYNYYINKFYGYINNYESCIGIDINSKGDGRTRYDRKLWDVMLGMAAESGKTVTAIATSDAHQLNKIDTGSTIILAENNDSTSVKKALLAGAIFPQSTCISNRNELAQIAEGLKMYYDETNELYIKIADLVVKYDAEREEKDKSGDDGQVGVSYSALDDEGFLATATRPEIKSIIIDEAEDTITIDSENALLVRWISDGKLIATTKADDTAFDLNDYSDVINGYVRAEVFGEGGVIYTEAFTLNADKATDSGDVTIIDLGFMDFIFAMVDRYGGLFGRIIGNLFN